MIKRSMPATDGPEVARLRRRRGFEGQILLPGDGAYHAARRVWNAMVDRRPVVIARCASPTDVAAAVRFARTEDLEIGVRGGGMGWLARRHGLACDNVARFELVNADGELLHASEQENPDLYWGLRGGGGNFGVVTDWVGTATGRATTCASSVTTR